jgi:hypothetical protein
MHMSSFRDKKNNELVIIELFRDRYNDFPKGDLIASESPDFILSIGPKRKFGLELTRLHQQITGTDPFSHENISACLQQKEEKLRIYRKKKLQEYWLILNVQDPSLKPRYNLHNKMIVWKFCSGYNRVFLFNSISGEVFILDISG